MNRRQRRAQDARDRVAGAVQSQPHCSHPREGVGFGCPRCRQFTVHPHRIESDDCDVLMCCTCGEKVLTYREHAPASFIAWLEAEVARLDAGGEPPEPCEGGREAYAALVRQRLGELLATRAREAAWGRATPPTIPCETCDDARFVCGPHGFPCRTPQCSLANDRRACPRCSAPVADAPAPAASSPEPAAEGARA